MTHRVWNRCVTFSSFRAFTGLHYQNLKSLRKENFHNKYGQKWIFMVREQTDAFIHIPLPPVPQMILEKYKVRFAGTDELLPVPSNQRLNVYLKEIAELCGIEKNMTMYLAYHTFKDTITTKNGISTGTVCRMLGRFDLRGRHAYVTDRIIKREMDRVARNCTPFEKNCGAKSYNNKYSQKKIKKTGGKEKCANIPVENCATIG